MFIPEILEKYHFPQQDIVNIELFQSRDGFILLEQDEFRNMEGFFAEYPEDFAGLLPIMTDNNSNYICVYFSGSYQFQVALLNHDEMDLSPKFSSLTELISTINQYPECYDIDEILMLHRES